MEIGSFIEMEFRSGHEYYSGSSFQSMEISRLNSGRAAIWHAYRVLECNAIWIPYYQCKSVITFLRKKEVIIKFYSIDVFFNPIDLTPNSNEAVLLVNYFGIMSPERMHHLASQFKNVIIDNTQAFFALPIPEAINVYTARKFVGVPDGAYVIGKGVKDYVKDYPQGYSSDTAQFLLMRVEYGCEGRAYQSRMINERRIESEDVMQMSVLSQTILDGCDYQRIIQKRRENFAFAQSLFEGVNQFNPNLYYSISCVPMVYPLVVIHDKLLNTLIKNKHFQGRWWEYILEFVPINSIEYWLSKYMIPITIDQRYGITHLKYLKDIVEEFLHDTDIY